MAAMDLASRPDGTAHRWLVQLELRIERSLEDAAECFREIREKKLYMATHGTWEVYCRERWGRTSNRIVQLMTAGETVKLLRDLGVPPKDLPTNERQVRRLRSVPAEQLKEAWMRAPRPSSPWQGKKRRDLVDRIRVKLLEVERLAREFPEPESLLACIERMRSLLPAVAAG
jgi:hypothetical protein